MESFQTGNENAEISQKAVGSLRFMTYNVNMMKNRNSIFEKIHLIKPDVIVMQEVPGNNNNLKIYHKTMLDFGYKDHRLCVTLRPFGRIANVLYSKLPIKSSKNYYMNDKYLERYSYPCLWNTFNKW